MAEGEGLYSKYEVKRISDVPDEESKHNGCRYFVLDPQHDLIARDVLWMYASRIRLANPTLAKDIEAWLVNVEQAEMWANE